MVTVLKKNLGAEDKQKLLFYMYCWISWLVSAFANRHVQTCAKWVL